MKELKNGLMNGLLRRTNIFLSRNSLVAKKVGKSYS